MSRKQVLKQCRRCGQWVEVNRNGYCPTCATMRWLESIDQMRKKSGPFYERWKARLKVSLERKE